MESNKKKMVTLKSSDGTLFEVEEEVAFVSPVIKKHVRNKSNTRTFSLPDPFDAQVVSKVIEYCQVDNANGNDNGNANANPKGNAFANSYANAKDLMSRGKAEFVKSVDPPTLLRLSGAAGYLELHSLFELTNPALDLVSQGVKTTEELQRLFNINEQPEGDAAIIEVEVEHQREVIVDDWISYAFSRRINY